jgi:hypothetical protein
MLWLRLTAAFLCSVGMLAAQDLPAGTAIPVMLSSWLDASKQKPGETIEGKTMQEVSLPAGASIKRGSHVTGHIVAVKKTGDTGSRITLQFDQLEDEGKTIALSVSLRALASAYSVSQTQNPLNADSTYLGSNSWTTRQVGGDIVNRGRGLVGSSSGIVGKWTGSGVWGKLTPAPERGCPATDGNDQDQALWVFSTSACGVYGSRGLKLAHAGRTDPVGQIVLESQQDLRLRGGSGWLLLVNSTPSPTH